MKGRPAGSKCFKWSLETRLLLIEILTTVELDEEFKRSTTTPADDLLTNCKRKWEEVGSRLPTVFDAIDPTRRGSTCSSQFVKLRQRLRLMRLDRHNVYRRANGRSDPIMTNELCWKMAELQENFLYKGRGDHDVAVSNDNQSSTTANQVVALNHERPGFLEDSNGEDVPASNDKHLCTVRPELPASQLVALHGGRPRQDRHSQKSCKNGVRPEMSLCKILDSNRSGTYKWSEDARLQVIQGVKMMAQKHLSQAGQIKSWREIAASLPKNLFWDIDLDRLANIAKKQFSEMRRRYRITRDHEISCGRTIKFKSLTKSILREMATYEESCPHAQRPPRASQQDVRKLCNKEEDILWITKTPSQDAECPGAHGAVLVEIFSRSGKGIENNSFGGPVFAEFDPVYDACGRNENCSILPNDGESSDYDEKESADRQTTTVDSNSQEFKNSESSYKNLLDSDSDHYANEWEAQDLLRTRERGEDSSFFENGREYRALQQRQTMSSLTTSHAKRYLEPQQENSSERHVVAELLCRQRGCSSAISVSSAENDPESDHPKIDDHLRKQEGSVKGYRQSSANNDLEESLHGRHPHSEGNDELIANEKLDGNQTGHLQRQIHWQRGITPVAPDEIDSHSENRQNGTADIDDRSESFHRHSEKVEYDSASTDNESRSHGGRADSLPHFEFRINDSVGGNFVQSDSIDKFLNGERLKSFNWKNSSPASDCQWDESARQGRETTPTDHSRRDHQRSRRPCKRAKLKGQFKHREAISSSTAKMTDSSGPEHDHESSKSPPVLNELLKGVDLGFSKLIWWLQHQLLPMEREKIRNVIKSASIPNTLRKRLTRGAENDEAVSKCRQNRIRWVLKAELQQVRLKLVEEIDKSSQVVIQEILGSLNM